MQPNVRNASREVTGLSALTRDAARWTKEDDVDHAQHEAITEPVTVQDSLFDGDYSVLPEDLGFRGPVACLVTGITYRQLDYWARTGLVVPEVRAAEGSGTQRLYSFRDILMLKVVKRLLDAGITLQQIRRRDQPSAIPRSAITCPASP